ncbi:MAG: hypothetical protein WAN11_15050, partial [Syntrophobacteraceae bacterium]
MHFQEVNEEAWKLSNPEAIPLPSVQDGQVRRRMQRTVEIKFNLDMSARSDGARSRDYNHVATLQDYIFLNILALFYFLV